MALGDTYVRGSGWLKINDQVVNWYKLSEDARADLLERNCPKWKRRDWYVFSPNWQLIHDVAYGFASGRIMGADVEGVKLRELPLATRMRYLAPKAAVAAAHAVATSASVVPKVVKHVLMAPLYPIYGAAVLYGELPESVQKVGRISAVAATLAAAVIGGKGMYEQYQLNHPAGPSQPSLFQKVKTGLNKISDQAGYLLVNTVQRPEPKEKPQTGVFASFNADRMLDGIASAVGSAATKIGNSLEEMAKNAEAEDRAQKLKEIAERRQQLAEQRKFIDNPLGYIHDAVEESIDEEEKQLDADQQKLNQ